MKKIFLILVGISILLAGFVLAAGEFNNPDSRFGSGRVQYYQPSFNDIYSSGDVSSYWPALRNIENDQCEADSDFIIGIPPGGCSPSVVRSDLLAEQNVPVFCQLYAIKVNPLIKTSSIRSISFKGDYPEGVKGISFHPARAAVNSYRTLLGDPYINNIGYVVIILDRQANESNLENFISGELTAKIRYDAEDALGAGRSEYYLNEMSEEDWLNNYAASSFFGGRGFVRVESMDDGEARIGLYNNHERSPYRTVTLKEGETSNSIYFPGYYCKAGLKVRLNDFVGPEDEVLMNFDGQYSWVRKGSKFFDTQCSVRSIDIEDMKVIDSEKKEKGDLLATVGLHCPGKRFNLKLYEKSGESVSIESKLEEWGDDFFKNANDTTIRLLEDYRFEKGEGSARGYAEDTLYEQIELSKKLGKQGTQKVLLELFVDKFPSSEIIESIRLDLQNVNNYNYSEAYKTLFVNGKIRSIGIVNIKKETENAATVEYWVEGYGRFGPTNESDGRNDNDGDDLNGDGTVRIVKIKPGSVTFTFTSKNSKLKSGRSTTIREGNSAKVGGVVIEVRKINIEKKASVSIIPEVRNTETQASFTFNIGIEERLLELSPQKAAKLQKNINKSIKKWENINSKLNTVLRAWNGACYATSLVLNLKSSLGSFDGESIARKNVMPKYEEICRVRKDLSRSKCILEQSDNIEKDVKEYTNALQRVNNRMDKVLEEGKTGSDPFVKGESLGGQGSVINQKKYIEALQAELDGRGKWSEQSGCFDNVDWGEVDCALNSKDLTTTSQIRAALLDQELKNTGVSSIANEDLGRILASNIEYKRAFGIILALEEEYTFEKDGDEIIFPVSVPTAENPKVGQGNNRLSGARLNSLVSGGPLEGVKDNASYFSQIISANGKKYLYVYREVIDSSGDKAIDYVGAWNTGGAIGSGKDKKIIIGEKLTGAIQLEKGIVTVTPSKGDGQCINPIEAGHAKVSYYESGRNQGLPALVTFDFVNGWYAKVSNSAGTLVDDNPKGYRASGDVENFQLCNVGRDGRVETRDDFCQSVDSNTQNSVSQIGCGDLNEREVQRIYRNARLAIREAAQQYPPNKEISIFGRRVVVDRPRADTGDIECTDFMSPKDCNRMFNVCDPVICPTSRCDLGGKYPVANVVQSGIVGSTLLCLPNFPEVKVPICLTGVHAGLDNYISVLKSEQACLQERIDTGAYVGICDEITSIYTCELFWEQAFPILGSITINSFERASGGSQGTRGGGEYRTVKSAFDNLEKSLEFFEANYANRLFRVFSLQGVSEIGTGVCSSFVGTSYPNSANLLDSILEPESPSQYYARFSQDLLSDATIPPTAHYKVYFHIFAGNEKGVSYRVYLRNPPATSYYTSSPTIEVARGFIPKGEAVDESRDLTAPEGYKDLCVLVDGLLNCGFGETTSDIGLALVQKKYVSEQAEARDIETEDECLSGTRSLLPLISLNLQAGIEKGINPDIAFDGIIRVCATNNPGGAIGQLTKWEKVGLCGDSSLKCWLDTDSVKEDLRMLQAFTGGTSETLNYRKGLIDKATYSYEEVQKTLTRIRQLIRNLQPGDLVVSGNVCQIPVDIQKKIIDPLERILGDPDYLIEGDNVIGRIPSGTNADRAEAYSLIAEVQRLISNQNGEVVIRTSGARPKDDGALSGSSGDEDEGGEDNQENVGDFMIYKLDWGDVRNYYYRFNDGSWEWSVDQNNWVNVNEKLPGIAASLIDENIGLVKIRLINQDFEGGKETIELSGALAEKKGFNGYESYSSRSISEDGLGRDEVITERKLVFEFGDVVIGESEANNLKCIGSRQVKIGGIDYDGQAKEDRFEGIYYLEIDIDTGSGEDWRAVEVDKWINKDIVVRGFPEGGQDGYYNFYATDLYDCFIGESKTSDGVIEKTPINKNDGISDSPVTCQESNGENILRIARSLKTNEDKFSDEVILSETGVKNFECMVLQLAMQESSLVHCGKIGECSLECNGENILKFDETSSGDYSYGIMQLNTRSFGPDEESLEDNIRTGINNLIEKYDSRSKYYYCSGAANDGNGVVTVQGERVTYSKWKRTIRAYNGWNYDCFDDIECLDNSDCGEGYGGCVGGFCVDLEGNNMGYKFGDPNYVDNVLVRQKGAVLDKFSECV